MRPATNHLQPMDPTVVLAAIKLNPNLQLWVRDCRVKNDRGWFQVSVLRAEFLQRAFIFEFTLVDPNEPIL